MWNYLQETFLLKVCDYDAIDVFNNCYCFYTDPLDYTAVTTELTFDSDRSRECVSIRLANDNLLESTEEFEVSLSTDEEQVIVNPQKAVVSILDTDGMTGLNIVMI